MLCKRNKQIRKLEVIAVKVFVFLCECGRHQLKFLFSSLSGFSLCFQALFSGSFSTAAAIFLSQAFSRCLSWSHTIRLKFNLNGWKNNKQRKQNSECLYTGQFLEPELYLCVIHHGLKLSSCTLIKGWTIHKHCYYGESVMILALESSFPDLHELWPDCPLSIRLVVFSALTQNVVVSKAAKSCYGSLFFGHISLQRNLYF